MQMLLIVTVSRAFFDDVSDSASDWHHRQLSPGSVTRPMTATSHASATTPGTYYDLFCRHPEMITIIWANVITTYNFLQRHLLWAIMDSSRECFLKHWLRPFKFIYSFSITINFYSSMLVELYGYLFTFNLCLTAICLFLLKFYLLT